jgi:hypothetical protein
MNIRPAKGRDTTVTFIVLGNLQPCATDRLDELPLLGGRHAKLYRMQPFLSGPDLTARLRGIYSNRVLIQTEHYCERKTVNSWPKHYLTLVA